MSPMSRTEVYHPVTLLSTAVNTKLPPAPPQQTTGINTKHFLHAGLSDNFPILKRCFKMPRKVTGDFPS